MRPVRFGTDGVRGLANVELTAELALSLGRATARVLRAESFIAGRDTRLSGPLLQAAFCAGLASEGAKVCDVGVLPTPALAMLAQRRGVPAAVVSASHNPFFDNGIKLFDAAGAKLAQETELAIERELASITSRDRAPNQRDGARPSHRGVGIVVEDVRAQDEYRHGVVRALQGRRLDGLHVVLDCANGAASRVAPAIFESVGARVEALFDQPDGTNINDGCGSTHPGPLAAAVESRAAALGLAFDGDADRLVAVDHRGAVLDGDALIALFALDLERRGMLPGPAVVVTVMSNLGLKAALAKRQIATLQTPVGDRAVLEALEAGGLHLGGEQSGHIVFRHLATTGDGILTALLLADLVMRSGLGLAALASGIIERVPQLLRSVAVLEPQRLGEAAEVWKAVEVAERAVGAQGRVLLRASGTEAVVRVMVETQDEAVAARIMESLTEVVQDVLGRPPA
ncbi:MAG: phosphoglucosamine mutase [Acidimicrobiales bacterium]